MDDHFIHYLSENAGLAVIPALFLVLLAVSRYCEAFEKANKRYLPLEYASINQSSSAQAYRWYVLFIGVNKDMCDLKPY